MKNKQSGFTLIAAILFITILLILVSGWMTYIYNVNRSSQGVVNAHHARNLAHGGTDRTPQTLQNDRNWADNGAPVFDLDFAGGHYKVSITTDNVTTPSHAVILTAEGTHNGTRYGQTKTINREHKEAYYLFVSTRDVYIRNRIERNEIRGIRLGSLQHGPLKKGKVKHDDHSSRKGYSPEPIRLSKIRATWLPRNPEEAITRVYFKGKVFPQKGHHSKSSSSSDDKGGGPPPPKNTHEHHHGDPSNIHTHTHKHPDTHHDHDHSRDSDDDDWDDDDSSGKNKGNFDPGGIYGALLDIKDKSITNARYHKHNHKHRFYHISWPGHQDHHNQHGHHHKYRYGTSHDDDDSLKGSKSNASFDLDREHLHLRGGHMRLRFANDITGKTLSLVFYMSDKSTYEIDIKLPDQTMGEEVKLDTSEAYVKDKQVKKVYIADLHPHLSSYVVGARVSWTPASPSERLKKIWVGSTDQGTSIPSGTLVTFNNPIELKPAKKNLSEPNGLELFEKEVKLQFSTNQSGKNYTVELLFSDGTDFSFDLINLPEQ